MSGSGIAQGLSKALATTRATPAQRRVALAIGAGALLAFVAVVPFARLPLPKAPAFIPAYQTALFFIDLITAVLLVDQFLRLRSSALLVLAAGYLFDALIIVPHTLSFPGAFATRGLLAAGEQTTAWLYVFWHGGFPLFVIAYALLRRRETAEPYWTSPQARGLVAVAVLTVIALTIGLAVLATWGHDLLPVVMNGDGYAQLVTKGVSPAVWLLTLLAIALLWQRDLRVMDLWLMLVMWIWLFDIALAAILGSRRFDLGFYAGRIFGLLAAGFLLMALIVELARLYAGALRAAVLPETEAPAAPPPAGPSRPGKAEPAMATDSFIHSRNIDHYCSLLRSDNLSATERHTVEQLLSAEEKRLPS